MQAPRVTRRARNRASYDAALAAARARRSRLPPPPLETARRASVRLRRRRLAPALRVRANGAPGQRGVARPTRARLAGRRRRTSDAPACVQRRAGWRPRSGPRAAASCRSFPRGRQPIIETLVGARERPRRSARRHERRRALAATAAFVACACSYSDDFDPDDCETTVDARGERGGRHSLLRCDSAQHEAARDCSRRRRCRRATRSAREHHRRQRHEGAPRLGGVSAARTVQIAPASI